MVEANEQRQRFGYTDESGSRVSALRDMLNGGGRGQAGDTFEGGGILSAIGNAFGGPRQGFGYTPEGSDRVSALQDMLNGGGRGMAGQQFQGGLLSAILNSLGVRPAGYVDPEEAAIGGVDETAPSLMFAPASTPPMTSPRPGMRSSGPGPMVPNYSPMQPGMSAMPDGEAFLRQNLAVIPAMTGPSMTMPQSDIGTVRPFTSRVPTRMPMQGFAPVFDISNPPPAPMGAATPPNAGVAAANRAYIEMQRRAAARGNPIRPMLLPR